MAVPIHPNAADVIEVRSGVWSTAFCPSAGCGAVCFGLADGSIVVSDDYSVGFEVSRLLKGHSAAVSSLCFCDPPEKVSDGGPKIASGSFDRTVRLWEAASGRCLGVFSGHTDSVFSTVFFHGMNVLASGSRDSVVCLWNLKEFTTPRQTLRHGAGSVFALCSCGSDAVLASGGSDMSVVLWDLTKATELRRMPFVSAVQSLASSMDGDLLAVGTEDGNCHVCDRRSSRCLSSFCASKGCPTVGLSFDPIKNQFLAAANMSGGAAIWDWSASQVAFRLGGHRADVLSVSFSAEGDAIATGCEDRLARLWRTRSRAAEALAETPSCGLPDERKSCRSTSDELCAVPTVPEKRASGEDDSLAVLLRNTSEERARLNACLEREQQEKASLLSMIKTLESSLEKSESERRRLLSLLDGERQSHEKRS